MREFHVGWAERLETQAKAKRALVEGLRAKPHVPAAEVIPWDAREAERIRQLAARPPKPKAAYSPKEPDPPAIIVCLPPSNRMAHSEPIRFSAMESAEFTPVVIGIVSTARGKSRSKAWRKRQWRIGNRSCAYCRIDLVQLGQKGVSQGHPQLATVDHKHPLALGGDDAPWNLAMCCLDCNGRKGFLTEDEFRALVTNSSPRQFIKRR